MPETDPNVWERQSGEPSKWYERFLYFLQLGTDRTIEEAFRVWWDTTNELRPRQRGRPKRPPSSWYPIVREWNWVTRAIAWDDMQSRQVLAEQAKAQADMVDRHTKIAMSLQRAALVHLNEILKAAEDGDMSAREVLAYLEQGVKLERQARGFPTETLEYYALTDEELIHKYGELYRRLAAAGSIGSSAADAGNTDTGDAVQSGDEAV